MKKIDIPYGLMLPLAKMVVLFLFITASWASHAGQHEPVVKITFLQLNDVYEMSSVNGDQGGLARVATLRKQLLAKNPHTFTVLAGDLFSPSAIGTAEVAGERLAGEQMVALMNELGLDYATLGNHEFDIKEGQFLNRLSESKFMWLSSNIFDSNNQMFPKVLSNTVFEVKKAKGTVRIGMFGLGINPNKPGFVSYVDYLKAARGQVKELRSRVDILVALTHQTLEEDIRLANEVPEIDLILGGHEHDNILLHRGQKLTPIAKADANARSVFVHELSFNTKQHQLKIDSRLIPVNDKLHADSGLSTSVQHWRSLAFAAFKKQGVDPEIEVAHLQAAFDGRETSVRNRPTALTELIAKSMLTAVPGAELAIFNSGMIRIDDVIGPGPVTGYDVIRIMPFGGRIMSVNMTGAVLKQTLDQGQMNIGGGGYLQSANVAWNDRDKHWLIHEKPLEPNYEYRVAINDFLLSGREQGLGFLTRDNTGVKVVAEQGELRINLIKYLKFNTTK